jgi:hypothetical protein
LANFFCFLFFQSYPDISRSRTLTSTRVVSLLLQESSYDISRSHTLTEKNAFFLTWHAARFYPHKNFITRTETSFCLPPHFYALPRRNFTKKIPASFAELPHYYALSRKNFTKKIPASFAKFPHFYALPRKNFTKKILRFLLLNLRFPMRFFTQISA